MEARVDLATTADCSAIAAIYNAGIDDGMATFETRHRAAEEIEAWVGGWRPVVVVREGDRVVAFAACSEYRPRACYRDIAEFSVYVAREARGRGLGGLALEGLAAEARAAGVRKLVARVFEENAASRRLLAHKGFREVGIYRRHGRLGGLWHDVVIVERLLDEPFAGPLSSDRGGLLS